MLHNNMKLNDLLSLTYPIWDSASVYIIWFESQDNPIKYHLVMNMLIMNGVYES